MTISLNDANNYFLNRLDSEEWEVLDDEKKQKTLNTAETIIQGCYSLKDGFDDNTTAYYTPYFHAVCEQAIYMLQRDNERMKLQNEGVTSYTVDDMQFTMTQSLISPLAKAFLKPLIIKQVGVTSC
jgi:hypothetical protein